jgi:opacity protein-like surface antigen
MRIAITILLAVILTIPNFAGDPTRKGTTGADQLLIPVGARGIATGGAFLSNVTGLEAIYYNPAGLDVSQRTEGMFSHMSYLADIGVSYFAAGTSLGSFGSVALSFKTFDFGEIPVTTFESPDGTGATYSPSFLTAGITYSKIITDRVSIGVNAKVISETIMSTNATAFALDFGVQYRFESNLSLSATVKNLGTNMQYTGQDLQVKTGVPGTTPGGRDAQYSAVTEPFQIPSFFEMSLAYAFDFDADNMLQFGGTFVNNNAFEDEVKLGMEYGFMDMFFVRGGYNLLTENTDDYIYGFTFGAGVDYYLSDGLNIVFDYAFREVKEFPDPNHVFTVKLGVN